MKIHLINCRLGALCGKLSFHSLFLILLLLLPLKAMACGLDWSEPTSHFENVDFQGNVHIVRKLAVVDDLPIYLIFNSTFGESSHVGSGFEIPLLDARIVQVDENRFVMRTPSGWLWPFQRSKVPDILDGTAGWKGLIKEDSITVWAECGSKIVFKKGRIFSMQLKDKKFTYAYKGNRVESIQLDGKTILEVEGDGTAINLPLTRERIELQQLGTRPVVETIGGVAVVSRVVQTLGEITKPDGSKETFEFGVDEKMNPTLKLGDKTIAWNPATKKVIQDGDWAYQITPSTDIFANAAIGRKSANGQEEFWHHDGAKGEEVVQGIDGVKRTETWFTSGNLAEKTRKVTESNGSITRILEEYSYDENGDLLRSNSNGMKITYSRDISKIKRNLLDRSTIAIQKNETGEVEKVSTSWFDTRLEKGIGGTQAIITSTASGTLTRVLDKEGRLVKITSAQ